MAWNINSAKLVIEIVDDSTGEIITREATLGDFKEVTKKTTRARKPKDDNDPIAKITLLDNKLQFNTAAINLTGFEPEDKILVQFEKKGRVVTPCITINDKGNRLTKTYTVSFRGSQHDNLAEYGTVFELVPYEGREGVFKMKGDAPEKEDDIIDIPEEISSPEDFEDDFTSAIDQDNFDFSFSE